MVIIQVEWALAERDSGFLFTFGGSWPMSKSSKPFSVKQREAATEEIGQSRLAAIENLAMELGIEWENFVRIPGTSMYMGIHEIDEDCARRWLEYNMANRKRKDQAINRYANDMIRKFWKLTHEGIAFGIDGYLKDGQNRLFAIIQSGEAIKLLVCLGLDPEAQAAIDQGVKRTTADVAKLQGIDTTGRRNATAKMIHVGMKGQQSHTGITTAINLELLETYAEGLDFVDEAIPKPIPGITKAPVLGAIARAYYGCRHDERAVDRLKLFCSVLRDGQYGADKNIAAHTLRERLLGVGTRKAPGHGARGSIECYALTEGAIVAFLDEKVYRKSHAAKVEQFPFPHEEKESIAMVAQKIRESQEAHGKGEKK